MDINEADEGPIGRSPEDTKILRKLETWEKRATSHWSKWRDETRQAYSFVSGDQWSANDKAALLEQMRQPVVFNRSGPMVDAVIGAEVLNRQEVTFSPRTVEDTAGTDMMTEANAWARDQVDAEDEESDAFADCVICGMGWLETRMDYESDPEGLIRQERVDPLEMWVDPGAKKRNLSDRKYQFRARYRDRDDLPKDWRDKIGEGSSEGDPGQPTTGYTGPKDDYEHGEPEHDNNKQNEDKVWVKHFQWHELVDVFRIQDPQSGEVTTVKPAEYKQMVQQFLGVGMQPPPAAKMQIRQFYYAFICGGHILETGEIPCNHFTFHAITGKRDRNRGVWYGIVRAMIDPQMWANKWLSQILHILNTSAKGGLMYEENAIDNPRELMDEWAKPDGMVRLKSGALAGGKIMERQAKNYPQGLDRLLNFAVESMPQVTGINLEMLGLVQKEQAGVLEAQRKKSGYAILAVFFDALRRYRKEQGRVQLYFLQNYISDGRLIRITGPDGGKKYVPLIKDEQFAKYDVVVDEAPMSANQKELVWTMLMQMVPVLMKQEVPPDVWVEMLRYSPLPAAVSEKIAKSLTEAAQPDPQQQQIQQQMVEGEIKKIHSEAAKNQTQAMLNAAKAQAEGPQPQIPDGQFQLNQAKGQAELMKAAAQTNTENAKAQAALIEAVSQAQQNDAEADGSLIRAYSQVELDKARAEATRNPPKPPARGESE